nr:BAH domain and coiled coil containing 1 [Hymenolepis microstoma]
MTQLPIVLIQQNELPIIPRTTTPEEERPLIPGPMERSVEIVDEVDGATCQNTRPTSPTSTDLPPQGKFLMLSDLCDKLQILVVEDNRLRKATVFTYTEQNQKNDSTSPSITSKDNPYSRIWRIHLSPLDDSDESKRRRCTEEDFQAWALLQKAILYVIPKSPDQLVPGTRVCAIWSATLGNVYFPGRITDFTPLNSNNKDEITFPIQFDDGDSALVPFKDILLLPNDYKNPKGPCPLPSGRRRLRSPLMSSDSISSFPAASFGRNSKIRSDEGRTEMHNLMPSGGSGDKPDIDVPTKSSSPKVVWTSIGEPLETQCKGIACYKAFQRNVDNLVVRLNDTVTFMTARSSEIYLGRINKIYSTKRNIFKVTAHWLYTPNEMGKAGKIVANHEGAVFISNHFDDNEAFCISGPVRVANSYSEFLAATARRKRRKISTAFSSSETESTSASTKKRRRLTILDDSDESDRSSSSEESIDEDIPRYFIAGEYDFKECRVVSWDKDLAKELHLPASNNPS